MKLLLVLLFSACFALAEDAADQVRKMDRQWADATLHRDEAALNRILADDLKYVHGNASVQNKKEFIDSLKSGDLVYHTIEFQEVDVRVFGDTAIVMSKPRLSITMGGQDQKFEVRFLRVYVKRKGAWQLLAHQATRLA
jgi:ketosteroid isomerase-like protein